MWLMKLWNKVEQIVNSYEKLFFSFPIEVELLRLMACPLYNLPKSQHLLRWYISITKTRCSYSSETITHDNWAAACFLRLSCYPTFGILFQNCGWIYLPLVNEPLTLHKNWRPSIPESRLTVTWSSHLNILWRHDHWLITFIFEWQC